MQMGDDKIHLFLESLPALSEAVRKNLPISFRNGGGWAIESGFTNRLRSLFGFECQRERVFLQELNTLLTSLERFPVQFGGSVNQGFDVNALIFICHSLIDKNRKNNSLLPEVLSLRRNFIAFLFRLERENGGLDKGKNDLQIYQTIKELAVSWKSLHPVINNKSLTSKDKRRLKQIACYRQFAELLIEDSNLQESCFRWVLRDGNSVLPFIQFPGIVAEMIASLLNGRIARFGGDGLKVQKMHCENGKFCKVATLPIEGRAVSILDHRKEVVFRGGMRLTIGKILQVFRDKNGSMGELEYLADGIINWNVFLWGWWNEAEQKYEQVDLKQNDWWKQLPTFEILNTKQAQKRYGEHMDGSVWNVAAVSTRKNTNLDFEDSHSFEEIAIPLGDGKYTILPFGKWATQWPVTFLGKLFSVGATLLATISCVDENVFYTFRQHTRHSFPLTPQQGAALLEGAKRDFIKGLEGRFVYQIESENCARWVHEQIQEVIGESNVPNLFKTELLNSEPQGIPAMIFNTIKRLPESMQVKALAWVHVPLGALNGLWIVEKGTYVWKALNRHEFWKTGIVYLPAFLHTLQELGVLGFVTQLFSAPKKKSYDTFEIGHLLDIFFHSRIISSVKASYNRSTTGQLAIADLTGFDPKISA